MSTQSDERVFEIRNFRFRVSYGNTYISRREGLNVAQVDVVYREMSEAEAAGYVDGYMTGRNAGVADGIEARNRTLRHILGM